MKKRVFLQNAAIMTATTLLLRAIGLVFRVYISNRIGAEGMGLYQMILSVYMLASSFASSGLTTAVTRLCTDTLAMHREAQAKRILHCGIGIGVGIGIISAVIVCVASHPIAVYCLGDVRAIPSLQALSISLPFMGISCCIKGYFLAKRKVVASSFSQILEQLIRIGVIAALLSVQTFQHAAMSCCAILIGDTVAEAISCIYIAGVYLFDRASKSVTADNSPRRLRDLIAISTPITAGRYVNSGLRTIENVAIPHTLTAFSLSREAALSEFGKLKGMALPLIFFPSGFLNAFSALLIPEISEANALGHKKQLKRTVSKSITVTLLFAYGIGGVFWATAEPLSILVYGDASVGRYLKFLAPLTPVMYMESVAVGLLKGLNQQNRSLLYSALDSLIRIGCIFCLIPSFGMQGLLILMIFSNLLTGGLHLRRLLVASGCQFDWRRWVIIPILGSITGNILSYAISLCNAANEWNDLSLCMVNTTVIATVYVGCLIIFHCIDREDFAFVVRKRA